MGMTAAPIPSSPMPTDREQWPGDHWGGDQQTQMVTSGKVNRSHSRAGGNERTPEEQLRGDSMGKKWEKMFAFPPNARSSRPWQRRGEAGQALGLHQQ